MGIFKKFKKGDKKGKKGKNKRNQFISAEVIDIERLTDDSVALHFKPKSGDVDFSFEAGQYVNFMFYVDGNEERRSYSLASDPSSDVYTVGVKAIKDGIVSNYVNSTLKKGDIIEVSLPEGNFKLKEAQPSAFSVGIVAGSGITPLMSMLDASKERNHGFHLLFGNKTQKDIMFKNRLEELSQSDLINVHHFLSREDTSDTVEGRIEGEVLKSFIKENQDLLKANGFYLCGPEALVVEATATLKEFGVDEKKIHYELFTTPVLMKSEAKEKEAGHQTVEKSAVTVTLDGEEINFELEGNGTTVLQKVLSLGYDAPYSCQGGVCCTCKAKVSEGSVDMESNFALSDEDMEEGYVLTCQSRPTSETLKLSYDE